MVFCVTKSSQTLSSFIIRLCSSRIRCSPPHVVAILFYFLQFCIDIVRQALGGPLWFKSSKFTFFIYFDFSVSDGYQISLDLDLEMDPNRETTVSTLVVGTVNELLEVGSHKTSTQNVRNHPKNKSQTGLVWLERSFGRTMFIMWPYFGLIEEKTPLSHEVVCFQMPSIRYLSWGLLLHVNLNILVRNYFFLKHYYTSSEGAISHNVLYSHQLSIAHYQVRFYAYKYF